LGPVRSIVREYLDFLLNRNTVTLWRNRGIGFFSMRLKVALRGFFATGFALLFAGSVIGFSQSSLAQAPVGGGTEAYVFSIWDLTLGDHAREMDFANYADFACGTNGGPPSTELEGWIDFAICPAEPGSGLHEIYFRYDDTLEYWALAGNLPIRAQRYRSTTALRPSHHRLRIVR
jgi:hypothetical protein